MGVVAVAAFSEGKLEGVGSGLTYERLVGLSSDELAGVDVAEMNLLCAQGLEGAEELDVGGCLRRLDEWAVLIRSETERHHYQYVGNPSKFRNMEGYYKMMVMLTVLYQDLGTRYNGERSNDESAGSFFADSRDLFIHGLLSGNRTGTCSSIPVLVAALSRRLGYPVRLVSARSHLFARWDGEGQRFNIEATGGGLRVHPDEYYMKWPKPITPEILRSEGFLCSKTPKEELACFLAARASCLFVNGREEEARQVCELGKKLKPSSRLFEL